MRWMSEYFTARKHGANAFLFVGSIGDGFPRRGADVSDDDTHADALDDWADAMRSQAAQDALVWTYDIVRGFRFRTSANEAEFRRLLFGPVTASPQPSGPSAAADPIGEAQRQMITTAPLPSGDPGSALAAVFEVFEQAAATVPSRPCIAILRDIDAYLSQRGAGADRNAERLALALEMLAASDRFRNAGHQLLMSAEASQAVDARLTRPDSPIKLIRVAKPDVEERKAFVEDVVHFRATLKKRLADRLKALDELQKQERVSRAAALVEAKKALADFDKDRSKPSPREETVDAAVWRLLKKGDILLFITSQGCEQRRVASVCRNGRFSLASRGKDGHFHTDRDRRADSYYTYASGRYMYGLGPSGRLTRRSDLMMRPTPVFKGLKRIVRIPAEAADPELLLKRTSEARAPLEARIVSLKQAASAPLKTCETDALETAIARIKEALGNKTDGLGLPDFDLDEFAKLTQGFGYRDIAGALRRMRAEGKSDRQTLLKERQALLQRAYGDLLEIVEPAYGFEGIAGLAHVKRFFEGVHAAMLGGDVRSVPMGCLLMGPPGTGKTAIAEAFARTCGFLFVKMKNVRNMFVGESERRQEAALQALRDLAPAVVLRDEVDEEDSGRDTYQGDSGVSARMRRMWMEFLSDSKIRGRIFVISCTNRPERLDPALKRSGRTDERIPLLMPDAETRAALFGVMISRYGFASAVKRFGPYAKLTDGLSGADHEVIVRRAHEFAAASGKLVIDDRALRAAIRDFIPSASQPEIARMTLTALDETSSKRHLPEDAAKIRRSAETLARRAD